MRWIGGGGSEDRDVDESFVRDWELWRGRMYIWVYDGGGLMIEKSFFCFWGIWDGWGYGGWIWS